MSDTKFAADYSKRLSKCKKCKQEIPKGGIRLAKQAPNFFHDGDSDMKSYFHIKCLFDSFQRARATTKVIESTDEIDGFQSLNDDDKDLIVESIQELDKKRGNKGAKTATPKKVNLDSSIKKSKKESDDSDEEKDEKKSERKKVAVATNDLGGDTEIEDNDEKDDVDDENEDNDDDKFETFIRICNKIAGQSGHIAKTNIVRDFITKRNRVYNLNSVSMIKLCSKLFRIDQDNMTKQLNKNGEIADTIRNGFEESTHIKPLKKSKLTLKQVDKYLQELTTITKEQEQLDFFKKVASNCTLDDLQMFIRLVKKDLRINAGEKAILDAITPNAYDAFKVSRDLDDVIQRSIKLLKGANGKPALMKKDLSIKITLMKAVKPMLAEACKSVESAMKKCPNGMYAEIKYDGERLQVHKNGNKFEYFSRNLKPVQPHKVEHLKEFIPKAFPNANDLILDGEVLLYDTKTKKPLPFGSLGKHKKNAFKDATVCLFIFDCIYYNGKDLMSEPICERRAILEKTMKVIPGRIMLSEQHIIKKADKLRELIMQTINEGLEGLVLKDMKSIYEPGKRHWLKIKKDYLDSGSMADTADLVCLGAYYGTGNKGGLMSIFLMGVYNAKRDKWQTVTKCANGFDDKTLDRLQKEISVVEIHKNPAKVPDWLDVHRTLVPDFVVKNPKKAPVWEITGAEFSNSDIHTAAGISIRFPRVTRIRDDKSWKEATDLERLKTLFKISKEKSDVDVKNSSRTDDNEDEEMDAESEDEAKKPKKRSSNDTESEEKNKKPKIVTEKKPKKRESSDESDDDRKTENKTETVFTSDLPTIFKNCIIYLSKKCENIDKLKRYIIAYDGEIVDEYSIEDATHIVEDKHINDKEAEIIKQNKNAKRLSIEAIWKCIKTKKSLA